MERGDTFGTRSVEADLHVTVAARTRQGEQIEVLGLHEFLRMLDDESKNTVRGVHRSDADINPARARHQ